MKITKFGHCCLLIEVDGVRIVTDPGSFTTAQNELRDIDAIIITHEHQDHFHIESIDAIGKNNPQAKIVTNTGVSMILEQKHIEHSRVDSGESIEIKGVWVRGFGKDHAPIYGMMGLVENTGYMIADKFYFPGDNFYNPGKPVEILALPVAGPWMKISDAIDFAKAIKAKTAFGVHDGMIVPSFRGFVGMVLEKFVPETKYVAIADGETKEF